jgi:hypothetical protein
MTDFEKVYAKRARKLTTARTIPFLAGAAEPRCAELRGCSMSAVKNKRVNTHGEGDGVWGELIGVDNVTGDERAFTVFIRSGSFLIVNDKGEERLAGPDDGLNRREIFREVMSQFNVRSLTAKRPVDPRPAAGADGR